MKKRNPPETTAPAARLEQTLERYRPLLGADEFAALLLAVQQPAPPALRLNPLKLDPAVAPARLAERYAWQLQPVPFCAAGWQVIAAGVSPSQTSEYKMGGYYLQDAASMLPVELFDDFPPAPLLLDLAAAPGGKTTHLVSRSADRGLVIANDASPSRIAALRGVLQDWGAINVAVTQLPGERYGAWYPDTFDAVLLDAPCSMENLSHAGRDVSARERSELAQRQLRLLTSALRAVRPGGQIVYSTCTLASEEDEGVLDALLRAFPSAVRIEDLRQRLPAPAPALVGDGQRDFLPEIQGAARLWPHRFGTSGFFAARLTKTGSLPVETSNETRPPRAGRGEWTPLAAQEALALAEHFERLYAFDLPAELDAAGAQLWRSGERIYALPQALLQRFAGLPLASSGLLLAEAGAEGFAPSHEWVARFGPRFGRGRRTLNDQQAAAWLRGEDLHGASGLPIGQIVVLFDEAGRLLGRGRALSGRLKNLLPRRLI